MAVKVLQCNAACVNCYEKSIRENHSYKYDINKILESLKPFINKKEYSSNPTIHGGEPLLLKLKDIEKIFKLVHKEYGSTGVQTNLLNLNKTHIRLFEKYNTNVGISLDGMTKETNKSRGYEPAKVLKNMKTLKDHKINMSMITVLWDCNITSDLLEFIDNMYLSYGINSIRFIPGTVYDIDHKINHLMYAKIFGDLFNYMMENSKVTIQPIRDIIDLLMGHRNATCAFTECDPYYTTAEVPIFEDGELGNCLRSGGSIDGIINMRADKKGSERYESLRQISYDDGGCKDCNYWSICYGGCPGTAIDNDWRNKTRFCQMWLTIFRYVEKRISSLFPNIHMIIDNDLVLKSISKSTWQQKDRFDLEKLKKEVKSKCKTGDHLDKHGDVPHGDHTDHQDRRGK